MYIVVFIIFILEITKTKQINQSENHKLNNQRSINLHG